MSERKNYGPGTNSGHGHIWPRPDGHRMRCGGPALCSECAKDRAWLESSGKVVDDVPVPRALAQSIVNNYDDFLAWLKGECGVSLSDTDDHNVVDIDLVIDRLRALLSAADAGKGGGG